MYSCECIKLFSRSDSERKILKQSSFQISLVYCAHEVERFRLCLLHLYLGMCEFGDGLYANHTADGLDDDLRDDSHQDEGHGVGGSVADHRGLGIRLAGDGAQGRGGGHAAADAAQAFQNVHLEDFHADKVAGERPRR